MKTEKIDFNEPIKLPDLDHTYDKDRAKLRSAESLMRGKKEATGLANTTLYESPVNIDNILEEGKVEHLTIEYLDKVLGKRRLDKEAKLKAVNYINQVIDDNDPSIAEHFRDSCIDVLDSLYGSSKIGLMGYIQACLFVTYRSAGDTKVKAYTKTFPDRVMRMQKEGQNMGHLASYADIYSKTKAVVDIQAKMIIPTHILCHDYFYQALRVSVELMTDDKVSPKVRADAANNVMNHTKQPEIKKQELEINVKETDDIAQLRNALHEFSQKQHEAIIEGKYSVVDAITTEVYVEDKDEEV